MKENFDMRGYAKYLEENGIPGKNVPQEVMDKFITYEPTDEIKDLLEAIGKTKSERLFLSYVDLLEEEVSRLIEEDEYLKGYSPDEINDMDFNQVMEGFINKLNYDKDVITKIKRHYNLA